MNALPLPFLVALQFLTRLPLQLPRMPTPQEQGRSLLWYPLVGLLLGLLLWGIAVATRGLPVWLGAALLLCGWVAVTGALHLDGLADCADAWVGGHGDRERTLAIMKDPAAGPMAVVTLVMVLLLKFAALAALRETNALHALLLPPLLARAAMPALFLTTPYLRPGGLGAALAAQLPRRAAIGVTLAAALASVAWGWTGLFALAAAVASFATLRALLLQRLGGTTGDGAGALLELTELAVLLAIVIAVG